MTVRSTGSLVLGGFLLVFGCNGGSPPDPPDGQFCGGIAGFPCPGMAECIDDPRDDCDPQQGGADCGGICVCNVIAACAEGTTWDEEACECVKPTNPCAAVLCQVGTECVVVGDQGVCVPQTASPCGDTTCPGGMVCCNASCGICTPPGRACIQIACE